MSQWQELFVHRPEFGIIICHQCGYAVVPTQAERHLKDHHPSTTPRRRLAIAHSIKTLSRLAHRLEDVVYPTKDDSPVAGLPTFEDGLQCRECQWICRHVRSMQDHCNKRHGWVNNQRRGGRAKEKQTHSSNRMWDIGITCQRFFEYRQWQRLFAVRVDTEQSTPASQQAGIRMANSILGSITTARSAKRDERRIEGNTRRCVANPWLDFVGWHRHLAGFPVKALTQLVWPAKEEAEFDENMHEAQDGVYGEESEAALARACQATKRMIRYAFATSTVEHVGRAALEAVNRRETGFGNSEKPFYGKLKVQSVRKYMQVWVKMLRYVWRSADGEDMPKYRLTDIQRMQLERLQRACCKEDGECRQEAVWRQEAAEKASIVFWVAMFDQELHDNEFDSGIVSALAVLGLDEQGNWKAAFNYTQVLSAVITTMRAIVVYRAWLSRRQAIQRAVDDGRSEDEAQENAPSVVEGVDALTQRFMTLREFGGRISPMDRLYHQRTYGMRIRFSTKAEGRVSWQGEQLCIDNVSFSMNDIRSVVHGLVETVQQDLARNLLLTEPGHNGWRPDDVPALSVERLFDNPAQLDAGWSFLQDARNDWAEDGSNWMLVRVFQDVALKKRFVKHSNDEVFGWGDVTWNDPGIEQYFRAVRRWKEQLIVLVHLSAGAPARATELLSIQHQNGAEAKAQRGIFIENQMMAFVTTYHKGFSASGKFKIVHRFVPNEVAELVAYYLWLVRPFVEHLQFVTGQQIEEPTSFFWEPEEEGGWDAGEDKEMDEELHGEEPSIDEGDEEGFEVQEQESASKNVDGFWDTDRVRRVMYRETEKRIGVKIGVATWRQAYPAIQRQYSVDSNVKDTIDQLYEQVVGPKSGTQSIEEVRARQAGHGLHMEEMIYGLLLNENPFTTMHEREQFRQVSMDWHRMLHFRSAWRDDGRMPKHVRQQAENAQEEARRWRLKQMRSVDIDAQLRRVTQDEQAKFRGVQRKGLQAIVGGVPRVTIVMRTGGGKSLFFMIPAAGSKDGVTIVVVPVVSLRQDLVDRCEKVGLSVAAWDGSRPPYYARIVFITPESAVTLAFGRFVDEKRASYQLERIVIDECHTMLEASVKWRPKVLRLGEMAQKGVQMVYLTATLPPSEEEAWLAIAGVARRDMHIIRDVTTRPNVAYSVVKHNIEEEEQRVKELVQEKLKQYPDGQVIVYCRTVNAVKTVAEYTGGQAFYRAVGTSKEKAQILRRLTGEDARLFVATNALGLGIDAPRIRSVIHVGCPTEMKQYAQESGRAGRDGKESEAIVMRPMKSDRRGETPVGEWKMEGAMLRFLEGTVCRRITYDRHMDGRTSRLGCEEGEERCDVCRSRVQRTKRRRPVEVDQEEEEDVEAVRREGDGDAGLGITEDAGSGLDEDVEGDLVSKAREEREREYREMEAIAAQTRAIEQRARTQVIERYVHVEQLDKLFEQWQGHCSICLAIGGEGHGHREWRRCPQREFVAQVERCWKEIGRIRYNYSACFKCHGPQAICHSWQAMGGSKSGRFRRNHAVECQYPSVVRDIGATIWAIGEDGRVGEWLREQLQAGLITREGDKENGGVEGVIEWFGRKFAEGGVEVSGLCRMIWEFGQFEDSESA